MQAASVDVIVRNVSSRYEDVLIQGSSLDANILHFKQRLSEQYPSRPNVTQIKLVHAGKLLQDNQLLSQIFSNNDLSKTQSIHAVISRTETETTSNNATTINREADGQRIIPEEPYGLRNRFQPAQVQEEMQQVPQAQHQAHQHEQHQPAFPNIENGNEEGREDGSTLWTLIKLAFVVFIFSQGGGSSRLFILCFCALVIFLVQTGRLRLFTQIPFNIPKPTNVQPNDTQGEQGGILFEIKSLVIPFFFSLFPNWQASEFITHPVDTQAPAAAPVQE
ncbi:homocysteine-responsive endoplasmic reticulum-resident ubiquitin-like domain member 1 protein-like [Planoprotostelium fungivorum]|uniref:Homocysteine-responsive endoplasmic reticulum-resident ubiquitin-like domain member 1 protein-like n=1 Tax=Planoprotostelium fungivorum TaxID=1890364 RepID=A0A2P6NXU1_9EUKA|nr:homocysteine-responsive endoplasmic reticulum-resident ubiquitin-like domain member 1 protein-like [Planoprotostelium fungivorum]